MTAPTKWHSLQPRSQGPRSAARNPGRRTKGLRARPFTRVATASHATCNPLRAYFIAMLSRVFEVTLERVCKEDSLSIFVTSEVLK